MKYKIQNLRIAVLSVWYFSFQFWNGLSPTPNFIKCIHSFIVSSDPMLFDKNWETRNYQKRPYWIRLKISYIILIWNSFMPSLKSNLDMHFHAVLHRHTSLSRRRAALHSYRLQQKPHPCNCRPITSLLINVYGQLAWNLITTDAWWRA